MSSSKNRIDAARSFGYDSHAERGLFAPKKCTRRTKQMAFNFFEWMREGVKHSVLRGVSDAVETMGMPEDAAESRAKILKFLQEEPVESTSETTAKRRVAGPQRKLGRSISDIHPHPATVAPVKAAG
ncbi:MAG: hypothetical protein ACRC46_13935 [Thermoguttaceae bacterium]